MQKQILLASLFLLIIYSCKKDYDNLSDKQIEKCLLGEWAYAQQAQLDNNLNVLQQYSLQDSIIIEFEGRNQVKSGIHKYAGVYGTIENPACTEETAQTELDQNNWIVLGNCPLNGLEQYGTSTDSVTADQVVQIDVVHEDTIWIYTYSVQNRPSPGNWPDTVLGHQLIRIK